MKLNTYLRNQTVTVTELPHINVKMKIFNYDNCAKAINCHQTIVPIVSHNYF